MMNEGEKLFQQIIAERETKIASANANPINTVFPVNELASKLHPETQYLKITKIVEHDSDSRSYYFAPNQEKGTQHLAYFRAGQYISLRLRINGSYVTRPYAIRSTPKESTEDLYILTIKLVNNGFATPFMFKNWHVGTEVEASAPAGNMYIESLRDSHNIIAVAGGSGITPFYSMAGAILNGDEDANLTILYGSRDHEHILLGKELEEMAAKSEKIHIVNVLSDEDNSNYEHGFITAELIQKYAPNDDISIFICGPDALYQFLQKEIKQLDLPAGRVRHELSGNFGSPYQENNYPNEQEDKTFKLTVKIRNKTQTIPAKSQESVLVAMERAGITAPSLCRSGECGVCRARVINGQLFVPNVVENRRIADNEYGYVHTCVAYPLSDVEIEVPVHDLADQFG